MWGIDFFPFIALLFVLKLQIMTLTHLSPKPLKTYIEIASKQRDSIWKTTMA